MPKRLTREQTPREGTRVPLGGANDVLVVQGKDPNFNYHIFNEREIDIDRALAAGYVYANDGEKLQGAKESTGNANSRPVNSDGSRGILMKQPLEYYEADRAAAADALVGVESEISRHETGDTYGGIKTDVEFSEREP